MLQVSFGSIAAPVEGKDIYGFPVIFFRILFFFLIELFIVSEMAALLIW